MMHQTVISQKNRQRPTISEKLVKEILSLQELYHSKYLTLQLLNEMISLYVHSVECFDQKTAPMRTYFLGKIQQVLSRPEITKMLEGPSQEQEKVRDTIRMSGFMDMSEIMQENHKKDRDFNKMNSTQKQEKGVNDQARQKQRHLKIEMQMKVMRQFQQDKKKIQKEVQDTDKKQQETGKRIKNVVDQQESDLNQRLAMRKRKIKRKKSADHIKNDSTLEEPVIKVEELRQAQKQIDHAVIRFTLRMTQKLVGTGLVVNNEDQKGRVKMGRVQEQDDDQEQGESVGKLPMKKPDAKPKQQQFHIQETESSTKQQSTTGQANQKNGNPTARIGTVHDPSDKGRVTVRNREEDSSEDEQEVFF